MVDPVTHLEPDAVFPATTKGESAALVSPADLGLVLVLRVLSREALVDALDLAIPPRRLFWDKVVRQVLLNQPVMKVTPKLATIICLDRKDFKTKVLFGIFKSCYCINTVPGVENRKMIKLCIWVKY